MTKRVLLTAAAAISLALSAMGQELMDFGTMPTIHQETREMGIGSFHLQREGSSRGPRTEWVAKVEAFGLDGELVAELEIRWPDETTTDVNCRIIDTGNSYRYVGYEGGSKKRLEFEDHANGKSFSLQRNEAIKTDRHKVYRSQEEANIALEELRRKSRDLRIEGNLTSHEEVAAEYGEIMSIIGMTVFEVQTVLGIAVGQKPASLGDARSGKKILLCGPDEPFCNFDNQAWAEGEVLFGNKSACCTQASNNADTTCILNTTIGCCANSLCYVTSPFCFGYCACALIGYMWDCPPPSCV
jgi:hypothetical protein